MGEKLLFLYEDWPVSSFETAQQLKTGTMIHGRIEGGRHEGYMCINTASLIDLPS